MTAAAASWSDWLARWERFQESYVPHRELQLNLIADYVELQAGDGLSVLDLCSGPGSAARRLLQRLPAAEVVAVDCDPWLLALGEGFAPEAERIAWVEADLRDELWTAALPRLEFDAVVATTAMQWFTSDEIARIYRDVHRCLRPGGVFLSSDVIPSGDFEARRLLERANQRWRERARTTPTGEHWATFWAAARKEPAFAELLTERDRRLNGRFPLAPRDISFHDQALRAAGFNAVGEVWRHHANAIVLALREKSHAE